MKTNYKVILVGLAILIVGWTIAAFDAYRVPDFQISGMLEIIIQVGVTSLGLIMIGVGLMLEFTRRKYGVSN